ncbi:YkoF family thiamine/hydroxymethylpyrimidine-binding protein [Promicromonospora kroppenstedtii]|uniref:YkoF family thiamine/hydroxymethylpyrimidine-binding protein n=1 Tax=Promicromonospora kroppenstedtii TaxID=440482 RepID=A0ABW7XQU7_9MICO
MADLATSTDATSTDETAGLRGDPMRFGVGARITAAVMSDDYVDVILGALRETDSTGLVVETGDVSTYVGGSETDLLRYVTDLTAGIAASGKHAAITVHLSRGCPGEVVCELPGGAGPRVTEVPEGRDTGRFVTAEWALYPLADDVRADVTPDHMRDIYAAIELAKENGTFHGSQHFVTRLEGDAGRVLASAFAGWVLAGRTVQHVTSHLTLSVNSPSHAGGTHE